LLINQLIFYTDTTVTKHHLQNCYSTADETESKSSSSIGLDNLY